MGSRSSRFRSVSKFALWLLVTLSTVQAALAVPNFSPQRRIGYTTGDQWEPALAADKNARVSLTKNPTKVDIISCMHQHRPLLE